MTKRVLSLVVVTTLAGYTSTPNLSSRDTTMAIKPVESDIVANSVEYGYHFIRDGVPQEYQRCKTFYERFHRQASGVQVNFVVEQHEVTAEYLVVMDQRKLDAGQHSESVSQHHAVQIDNDRLGVLFKVIGFWTASGALDLAAAYQLAHPIAVSISDKTKAISLLDAVAMAPLFPFYMMYGYATGPRV